VDPSTALKQLLHEANHSALFSADVTDQCSCNCASPVCLHCIHRNNFVFNYCFGRRAPMSTRTSFCPGGNEGDIELLNLVLIQQYCVVSKHRLLLSDDLYPT